MKGATNALKKPVVSLKGMEENVYSLIGRISRVLDEQGDLELTEEFIRQALAAETYDDAVGLSRGFVEFENEETKK